METCTLEVTYSNTNLTFCNTTYTSFKKSRRNLAIGESCPNPPLANKSLILLGLQTKGVDWLI